MLQAIGSKRSDLKTLEKKVRPMEDLFQKFRTWLSEIGTQLSSLSPPSQQEGERSRQLQQAKVRLSLPLCARVFRRAIYCHEVKVSFALLRGKFPPGNGHQMNRYAIVKTAVSEILM